MAGPISAAWRLSNADTLQRWRVINLGVRFDQPGIEPKTSRAKSKGLITMPTVYDHNILQCGLFKQSKYADLKQNAEEQAAADSPSQET